MIFVLSVVIFFLVCITFAAYLSLIERKLIARIQKRIGPNNCGVCGVFQPLADALKLFFKKSSLSMHSAQSIFSICLLFFTTLIQLTLIPISSDNFNPEHELLFIILCQSVIAFSEVLIGSSSRSKYGVIGGHRAYVQTVGSHIPFVLSIIVIMILTKSLNLKAAIDLYSDSSLILVNFPLMVVFFISALMMLNKLPFDFLEAESELVAGAYVEYGGILFGMIYLSEYLNLMFMSALIATLFFGGHSCSILDPAVIHPSIVLLFKTFFIICFIILIRATLTRYKQIHMLETSWIILTPILFLYIIFML